MKPLPLHLFSISPERWRGVLTVQRPIFHSATQKYSLTGRIRMVQFISGNSARSFELRELAAAFLFPSSTVVANKRRRALYYQSVAKCNFCKSFALTFMQNGGGVGGVSATFQPSNLSMLQRSPFIPFVFSYSCALLWHNGTLQVFLVQSIRHSFRRHGGCVPPRRHREKLRIDRSERSFRFSGRSFLLNVEFFGRDFGCI